MNAEKFNSVVEEQLNRIKDILTVKQKEYNPQEDLLSVFKKASAISGETPEQALYGFMLKHLVSQSDMISTGAKYTKELWKEKITDIMNYNILLLAMLEEDNMFKEAKK